MGKLYPQSPAATEQVPNITETSDEMPDHYDVFQFLKGCKPIFERGTDIIAGLCEQVAQWTHGGARLILQGHSATDHELPARKTTWFSLPVQFGARQYGRLDVLIDIPSGSDSLPALHIPLNVANLLAEICGWLLSLAEQSVILRAQHSSFDGRYLEPLTTRERDVLALICKGYSNDEIMGELCISQGTLSKHCQHIYAKLGAHSRQEAILIAYHYHLVSFF